MHGIYVHGGVSRRVRSPADLREAVAAGLQRDRAVDAVVSAVTVLEDHPELNAGVGSVPNASGELELDAGIADGSSRRIGSVAGVAVHHPIVLARAVMERTPHVLLIGAGAARLAKELALEPLPRAHQRKAQERAGDEVRGSTADTVGAVAIDDRGRLCAGTSTGGIPGQWPGRVGDSAFFGAGFYASRSAAVVGTGLGELFIETLACARVGSSIEGGEHPQRACETVITLLGERRPGAAAGLLGVDDRGRVGAAFRGGSWSVSGPEGRVEAACLGRV